MHVSVSALPGLEVQACLSHCAGTHSTPEPSAQPCSSGRSAFSTARAGSTDEGKICGDCKEGDFCVPEFIV